MIHFGIAFMISKVPIRPGIVKISHQIAFSFLWVTMFLHFEIHKKEK